MGENLDLLKFEKLFKELDSVGERVLKLESYQNGLKQECEYHLEDYIRRCINYWCVVEADDKKIGMAEGRLIDTGVIVVPDEIASSLELQFYIAIDPFAIENIKALTEKEQSILSEIRELWQEYLTNKYNYINRKKYKELCVSLSDEDNRIDLLTLVIFKYEPFEMDELMKFLTEERQFSFFDKEIPNGLNAFYKTRQELREHLTEGE